MYNEEMTHFYNQETNDCNYNDSPAYIAGVDFDPNDQDEVEVIQLATEWDKHNRIQALEAENASLRAELEFQSDEHFDDSDVDYEEEVQCDWATEQMLAYTD